MKPSRRHVLVGVIAAWAVALAALAFFAAGDAPTVVEQVPVADSRTEIAQATGAALAAVAGYDDAVAVVRPFAKTADCNLTPVRAGVAYAQVVRVLARPEDAGTVTARLYDDLKERFGLVDAGAVGGNDGAAIRYTGEAARFVHVDLTEAGDGVITFTAGTGCRPRDDGYAEFHYSGEPGPRLASLAGALGVVPVHWDSVTVDCGDGRTAVTVAATVADAAPVRFDGVVEGLGEGYGTAPAWWAWPGSGNPDVTAYHDAGSGRTTLAATLPCA